MIEVSCLFVPLELGATHLLLFSLRRAPEYGGDKPALEPVSERVPLK